jgi:hypothetical protein
VTLDREVTTTNYEIGGVTYTVESSASEKSSETIHRKIEKLLLRDLRYYNDNATDNRTNPD